MASIEYGEKLSLPYFLGNAWGDLNISAMINLVLVVSEHQLEQNDLTSKDLAE